ncbi:hypothetical protein GPECTOR_526g516 [Gonium pectorale]|uniref:Uncharacterized protein n=1 Tax=Gonium pectorale TaxID=33097 RepID=A0A150FUP7_GONPE|nr:hypothetical protein GPECTOR_526g516 [Gonium pectorale]|eukprot:KXZ41353.1 hypothetical protein GPECTOR_526g516 [Gonium pectorale]
MRSRDDVGGGGGARRRVDQLSSEHASSNAAAQGGARRPAAAGNGNGNGNGSLAAGQGGQRNPDQDLQESDPEPEPELPATAAAGSGGSALPPTSLSGEALLASAPATPVILASTLDDKVAEIIARSATRPNARPPQHREARELLSGGGSSSEGKSRLFEINRIQSAITEVANSGYLESVKGLRETLMVQEWGLQSKNWARKRGVSAFEQWAAEHSDAEVTFDAVTKLYDDPDDLSVLPTPRLRMMARGMIEQATLQAYDETFKRCTITAEALAKVGLADLLPHTAGVGQVLRGLLPGGLPLLGGAGLGAALRRFWPFGRGGGG